MASASSSRVNLPRRFALESSGVRIAQESGRRRFAEAFDVAAHGRRASPRRRR